MSDYQKILEIFTLTWIDPIMIAVSMGLFFVFWKVLEREFYRYYVPLFEARLQATEGSLHEAAELFEAAANIRKKIDETLSLARSEALARRQELIALTKKNIEQEFLLAEQRIAENLQAAQARLKAEVEQVRAKLLREVPALVEYASTVIIN
jgi:F0F1-type ATP synthase membrane subunit b/b'